MMMKKIFLGLSCNLLFCLSTFAQNQPISLTQALAEKKIVGKFKWNNKSVHYLKPILVEAENLQNEAIKIIIEAGTFFKSDPEQYQDMTVLESTIVDLNSKEKKNIQIRGACSEATKASPAEGTSYIIAPAPKPTYVPYAKFIDSNKFYGTSEAQQGMWALSDHRDWLIVPDSSPDGSIGLKISYQVAKLQGLNIPFLNEKGEWKEEGKNMEFLVVENDKPVKKIHNVTKRNPMPANAIVGEKEFEIVKKGKKTKIKHYITREKTEPDSIILGEKEFEMVENGKRFKKLHYITKELSQPLGEIVYGQKDYKMKKNGKVHSTYVRLITNQNPEPMCEMWGNGRITIVQTSDVRVGMFDNKGVLVREIYHNPEEKSGTHTLEYAYDCDVYQDKTYYFKIIKNDIVTATVRLSK
ncbi:MAG: hypothetical protein EAZ44_02185 [Cytophagia bacterium]|nr:MAG: hypothetical protein EAZ44_02185 [Cytophagia bacterium]